VHGRFSIESRPGEGTKVIAAVPLVADTGLSQKEGETGKEATSKTGIG
jgi:hypothetical protein